MQPNYNFLLLLQGHPQKLEHTKIFFNNFNRIIFRYGLFAGKAFPAQRLGI
jgi:hypothetical protein